MFRFFSSHADRPVAWQVVLPAMLVAVVIGGAPRAADGQGLIDRYLHARFLAEARQLLDAHGPAATALAPARLPTTADSLLPPPPKPDVEDPEPTFEITERRVVQRLERSWFQNTFGDTKWAFLGNSSFLSPLDTTFTRRLRAQLEAQFGPPTLTLADLELNDEVDDYIQFEYWFVVNDSIPAIVMDVHGPYDRGVIVATDRAYRAELNAFRKALLEPVLESSVREPYVDYFYDVEVARWYRTGFDGDGYFIEPVRRRQVVSGRRPWLNTEVQAAGDQAAPTSTNQSSQ